MQNREEIYKLKELKIELTHRCPLACIHCSSDATPDNARELDPNTCINIIQQALNMKVSEIVFSGGEPLIWGGIEEVVELAASRGAEVTIYTSGNIDNVDLKLQALKKSGANKIVFSVFGSSSSLHERITRVRGSFDKTIQAATASINFGLSTECHFVPLVENYKDLPNIYHTVKSIGINRVSVLRFVPQGRGFLVKNYNLNQIQNLELVRIIKSLRESGADIRTGSPYNFLMLNDSPTCLSAKDRLIIGPDLRLYPCDAFKQIKAEEIVGTLKYSILDEFLLRDCWQNSPFLVAVRNHLEADFKEPCLSCNLLNKCISGCLAQKVIAYGEIIKMPDPMCIRGMGGEQN